MPDKYSKTVTISLTDADYDIVKADADTDRRSIAQFLSILVEQVIASRVIASRNAKVTTDVKQ